MNYTKLVLASSFSLSLLGCQSIGNDANQPQLTDHYSQAVYQVEFMSAQKFRTEADKLTDSISSYCASTTDIEAVKSQWHQTMLSWMALQGQERGPEAALAQSWNVQFWPDKKNTTGLKMSALIKQPNAWSAQAIALQSVTVQGLGSVEWLVFDQASDLKGNPRTCQTATSIAENLQSNANKIADAWTLNPWVELNEQQWQSEYIALLSNQLEYSMKKMSRPLANFGQPRPYFSESWRSKTSMQNLRANIVAIEKLYFSEGNGLDAILRQQDKSDLADRVANQFAMTIETWPTDMSLFDMLQTKQGYQNAYSQYNKLEQLQYLIHEEVAIELGVIIGFNATDGD
ncbi:imelysin family protein [Vibrio sp. Hep-1b-8]|uniref:imelysin family protein n=1 Tax=Vibrio sp. Hep-1b-8 TaxID=2144187 RepID=UPI00111008EB|nr:imelysin family protein [Vibrio sp. Hep-1b-8]TMX44165.1 iron-regulated protein A [Vibrio sp. Hep-1b-8]